MKIVQIRWNCSLLHPMGGFLLEQKTFHIEYQDYKFQRERQMNLQVWNTYTERTEKCKIETLDKGVLFMGRLHEITFIS